MSTELKLCLSPTHSYSDRVDAEDPSRSQTPVDHSEYPERRSDSARGDPTASMTASGYGGDAANGVAQQNQVPLSV